MLPYSYCLHKIACYFGVMTRIFAMLLVCLASGSIAISEEAKIKYPDCYCTDRTGQRVELGVSICMVVDGRDFWARCEMSLNNPTWREIRPGCLNAGTSESPSPSQDKQT